MEGRGFPGLGERLRGLARFQDREVRGVGFGGCADGSCFLCQVQTGKRPKASELKPGAPAWGGFAAGTLPTLCVAMSCAPGAAGGDAFRPTWARAWEQGCAGRTFRRPVALGGSYLLLSPGLL